MTYMAYPPKMREEIEKDEVKWRKKNEEAIKSVPIPPIRIGFTGHRDRYVNLSDLDAIADEFPDAIWVHGDAQGFDRQVRRYAETHGIEHEPHPPEDNKFPEDSAWREAPLARNRQIVESVSILFACYDGRQSGGTYYTIRYARKIGKPVRILKPK
jgi:hypothetical protein